MESEQLPKIFHKTTEVLPLTNYGILSFDEFKRTQESVQHLEQLKKAGLSDDEIKLYQQNEAGLLDQQTKIEYNALKNKLGIIYNKIRNFQNESGSSEQSEEPSTSDGSHNIFQSKEPIKFYPEGHPMHNLKNIEENLFGHFKNENILSLTKRRKILRRLERKKERILSQDNWLIPTLQNQERVNRPGSLWDMKESPKRAPNAPEILKRVMGPTKQTLYTIKDKKIVRLEAQNEKPDEFKATDIVIPINAAEGRLLEGTKMCVDDIRKIERFRDYEPGVPSKVLYMKNIEQSVTQERLTQLFNQFQLDDGGPVNVKLMSGRMRGQAFVSFSNEDTAMRALEAVNGTILCGRPLIVQFGRHSNRIQDDGR